MGLMDKFRGTMDRLTEKMDGLSEPPAAYVWPPDQPMAVLLESEYHPGSSGHSDSNQADVTSLAFDKLAGVRYRFVLDVRRPGMEPYRIEQRVRIPSKVQRSWLEGEVRVPKGAEVSLRVTGPGPEDVEIDWDGYLAIRGRK
jgi:hypothetical protein